MCMKIDKYSVSINDYLYGKAFRDDMNKRKERAYRVKMLQEVLGMVTITILGIVVVFGVMIIT